MRWRFRFRQRAQALRPVPPAFHRVPQPRRVLQPRRAGRVAAGAMAVISLVLIAVPMAVYLRAVRLNTGDEAGERSAEGWPASARRVRPPASFKDWTEAKAGGVDLARWWRRGQ